MATLSLLNHDEAPEEVREVFDEIRAARDVPDVNNFWKALAHDPATLRRIWKSLSQVMKPGALDPLTKEMLYIAVSIANGCEYCIHSHTAAARSKGMTEAQYAELLAVVGMASQTNALATGMNVPVDEDFAVAANHPEP